MRTLHALRDALAERLAEDADLALLAVLLLGVAPLVAVDAPLGRDDLGPWTLLALAAVAALRGAPLEDGPHPQLRPRASIVDAGLQRAVLAAFPLFLGLTAESLRVGSLSLGLGALGVGL